MKRSKSIDYFPSRNPRKWKRFLFLFTTAALYILFIAMKSRHFLEIQTLDPVSLNTDSIRVPHPKPVNKRISYDRIVREIMRRRSRRFNWSGNHSKLGILAHEAYNLGSKALKELESYKFNVSVNVGEKTIEACPSSVSVNVKKVMGLPCGLEVGSAVTVVGMLVNAHAGNATELDKRGRGDGEGEKMVSQFVVELLGLKAVDGEDPPRILHFNPRLKGDWSGRPVIEMNTCYRMQWGKSIRCNGLSSEDDDETVDGYYKCEKWQRNDIANPKESKSTSWLNRFIGRAKKPEITWPYPFEEGKLFVLTLRAGIEGYHIYVGGHHISSFPYRAGYSLEDSTGLAIRGNVNVQSVYATSLPKSHPSFSAQNALEMSEKWKSSHFPVGHVRLFIGILSTTSHFAERMAIRKSWMRYPEIKSSHVAARFFVALSSRKQVNALLKEEAEYFGDIVILPFMDRYELVVLKTIAICEYGVTAAYIMKCDDDTFVRVDVVLKEISNMVVEKSVYMGNLNLMHKPLRSGKWAVTYEEWPEDVYPLYANGPGYIISNDIASYIVSKHANQSLKMFKMEDVSMGMWVEEFGAYKKVKYLHSWKFCQFGCVENYFTAHYQSPRQMVCLWDKLARGQAQCCNFR